jgi:hypothetical protein
VSSAANQELLISAEFEFGMAAAKFCTRAVAIAELLGMAGILQN